MPSDQFPLKDCVIEYENRGLPIPSDYATRQTPSMWVVYHGSVWGTRVASNFPDKISVLGYSS